MNELQIFNNSEFGEIRTVTIEGEPWFVGADVAKALGYKKPTGAVTTNVDEGDSRREGISDANGHRQIAIVINESGLYSLIFNSKLETAKRFKHWVTSEVLPQLRKTGVYFMPRITNPTEVPLGELASYLKAMDRVAHRESLAPYKIAENFKRVSEQFGIQLTDDFVNVPEFEQLHLADVMKQGA